MGWLGRVDCGGHHSPRTVTTTHAALTTHPDLCTHPHARALAACPPAAAVLDAVGMAVAGLEVEGLFEQREGMVAQVQRGLGSVLRGYGYELEACLVTVGGLASFRGGWLLGGGWVGLGVAGWEWAGACCQQHAACCVPPSRGPLQRSTCRTAVRSFHRC